MSNDQSAERRKPDEDTTADQRDESGQAAGSEKPEAAESADRPESGRPEHEHGAASEADPHEGNPAAQAPAGEAGTGDLWVADAEAAESADAGIPGGDASEAETPETGVSDPAAEIERLGSELETARAQADDYWQRLVRSEAEKENVRKRAARDVENARKQGLEKLASELLGVRDSLELGVDAASQDDADPASIREGTELTLKMLTQALEKFDIEEIAPLGEKFDPDLHQAMSMQEVEGQESNTVISVMQKGYRLGDRLLRPALVMVAK